jgi:GNAT superfamily N-acetyltransferase
MATAQMDDLLERLRFDSVPAARLPEVVALEMGGFPPDEADTTSDMAARHRAAPHLFRGAFLRCSSQKTDQGSHETLVGFVCGSQITERHYTHAALGQHVPHGETTCVHSVVVSPLFQRRGVARWMLSRYVELLHSQAARHGVVRIALLTHAHLIPMYEHAGFRLLGLSPVVHGSEPWHEMQVDISERGEEGERVVEGGRGRKREERTRKQ